jgi:8-oxo-dGTP pyrophosphatase MutT (NUDIX family)
MLDTWSPPDDEQAQTLARFRRLFAEYLDPTLKDTFGAHITASALIVSAELDRVLLCLHGKVNRWLQVGGHCEPGDESLAGAALREATEESGMDGLRIDPVPINLNVHFVEKCSAGPSMHYDVRFAVQAPPGARPVRSPESHEVAWFAPTALPRPMGHATEILIGPALARFTGSGPRPGS